MKFEKVFLPKWSAKELWRTEPGTREMVFLGQTSTVVNDQILNFPTVTDRMRYDEIRP
jgi:hypothetical protein